jgi:hypothetical protein
VIVSRKGEEFALLHVVQTGSGVHPTSYPMGTGDYFSGVKLLGREADYLPPVSAEVKRICSIHPLPHTPSLRSAQAQGQH